MEQPASPHLKHCIRCGSGEEAISRPGLQVRATLFSLPAVFPHGSAQSLAVTVLLGVKGPQSKGTQSCGLTPTPHYLGTQKQLKLPGKATMRASQQVPAAWPGHGFHVLNNHCGRS